MKRDKSYPFVRIVIDFHGCISDPITFMEKLKSNLVKELDPDCLSDIEIECTETAGPRSRH